MKIYSNERYSTACSKPFTGVHFPHKIKVPLKQCLKIGDSNTYLNSDRRISELIAGAVSEITRVAKVTFLCVIPEGGKQINPSKEVV